MPDNTDTMSVSMEITKDMRISRHLCRHRYGRIMWANNITAVERCSSALRTVIQAKDFGPHRLFSTMVGKQQIINHWLLCLLDPVARMQVTPYLLWPGLTKQDSAISSLAMASKRAVRLWSNCSCSLASTQQTPAVAEQSEPASFIYMDVPPCSKAKQSKSKQSNRTAAA